MISTIVSKIIYNQSIHYCIFHSQLVDHPVVKKVLLECCNRVKSMSTVHSLIYKTKSIINLDVNQYTKSLTYNLLQAYGKISNVAIEIEVPKIQIDVNTRYSLRSGA